MAASKATLPLAPGKAAPAGGAWTTARPHAASDRISSDPVVCTWQRTRFAAVITQPSLFALRGGCRNVGPAPRCVKRTPQWSGHQPVEAQEAGVRTGGPRRV